MTLRRRREADPERARRREVRTETHRALAELDPRQRDRAAPPAAAPGRRGRHSPHPSTDALRTAVGPGAMRTLTEAGVDLGVGGYVSIGRLVAVHAGPDAPLRVQLAPAPALPKMRRVVAPSWLAIVRMLPCSAPGCDRGRPFYAQLQLGRSQSEANHHPGRGRAAGGSDLETHPLCPRHHRDATEGRIPDEVLAAGVARTIHTIVTAIRDGRLDPGVLLAAWVEAVIGIG